MTASLSGLAEDLALADVVDHEQVAALAGELGARMLEHRAGVVAGLGGEADDHGVGTAAVVGDLGEHVGVCSRCTTGAEPSSAFFIFVAAVVAGR